jgi:YVTN family beta-propeller protein
MEIEMKPKPRTTILVAGALLAGSGQVLAGQAPGAASDPDIPLSRHDRVYAADQFSNTVSVTDPASNELLGVIRLGDPQPRNMSPLYRGQVLVHGLGFAPDSKTLAVVSVGSNSVSFIDTASNAVKHGTYLGRSPHEAFFTPDGKEVWVTVRGEDYVAVLDGASFEPSLLAQSNGSTRRFGLTLSRTAGRRMSQRLLGTTRAPSGFYATTFGAIPLLNTLPLCAWADLPSRGNRRLGNSSSWFENRTILSTRSARRSTNAT